MLRKFTYTFLLGLILSTSVFANLGFQPIEKKDNSLFEFSVIQESDFALGVKAFDSGDFELAVFYYTRHLGKFPNDQASYYNRGLSQNRLKKFDLAIADFSRAIQLNPQDWKAFSSRGYSYWGLKNYNSAIVEFNKALELNPNDYISLQNRGLCYQELGQTAQANADFAEANRIKSGTPRPTPTPIPVNTGATEDFDLGYNALTSKNYDQAVLYFTRFISKVPNDHLAFYNRGLAYTYLNKPDLAISDYTKSISINPNYVSAYKNRAFVYKSIGRNDLADLDYARIAQIEGGTKPPPSGGGSTTVQPKFPPLTPNSSGYAWRPVVEMNNQIFPSLFLATASVPITESKDPFVIGDAHGKIGLHIISPQKNSRIKVGIQLDPIISYQEFEANLSESGKIYLVFPKIVWNWEALKKYKKPSPANATFTLFVNGSQVDKQNIVVRIRSLNEAVYRYRFIENENWADTGYLFAAYVNEDHEWIDKLLKEALDTRLVDSFSGYQGGPNGVLKQLAAIWFIFQRRGFKYSSITDTSSAGDMVYSQYVRLFEESITVSQANCVDGTVLLASILRKIGINVGLVLVPGHCYLVFDMSGKGDFWGLETTAIGMIDLNDYKPEDKVNASYSVLKKALEIGDKNLKEASDKIKAGDPRYNIISIDKARRDGIHPISF
ncbi:MAG: tetratricopeptide repeat protein [Pyrinomonadaceae bacterium]|jgi:tetratricopeptide (TPR) repeat protein|nr:tetratricopeptide repeat protein [Pyrinomonadaceae bacterium]